MRTTNSWRTTGLALIAGLVLVTSACGGSGDGGDREAGAGDGAVNKGGRLVALMPTEIPGLDPVKGVGSASGGPMQRMYAIFDALVYTESESGDVQPGIAESLETSDDGTTWDLTLRDGVTFTDGTPFDADAVVFNWNRHADPANASQWRPLVSSMKYTAHDAQTVRVELSKPNVFFPQIVARCLAYIGSPTALRAQGPAFNDSPVGAGPFVLKRWTRDSEMVLTKNPDYWNNETPNLDELVFKVVPEDGQRLNSWKAGEGDLAFVVNAATAKKYKEAGANLTSAEQFGGTGLLFNLRQQKLADVRVRQAIAMAIDREQLNDIVYEGALGDPKTWFKQGAEFSADVPMPAFDLEEAQALLDDYYADSGTSSVDFSYQFIASGSGPQTAELLQAQLQKLDGVNMTLNPVNAQQLVSNLTSGNFETSVFGLLGAGPEPEVNETFFSTGSRNLSKYSNPAVDEAIRTVRTSTDAKERLAAYEKVATQLSEDVPFIVLTRGTAVFAAKDPVGNLEMFEDGGLLWDRVGLTS